MKYKKEIIIFTLGLVIGFFCHPNIYTAFMAGELRGVVVVNKITGNAKVYPIDAIVQKTKQ